MKGSVKRTMGKPLPDKNKRAYFGPEGLSIRPDASSAGHLLRTAFKRSLHINRGRPCGPPGRTPCQKRMLISSSRCFSKGFVELGISRSFLARGFEMS